MSDNGGLAASSEWRGGELHTQNAPLRSGKGSLLEGGIREPMIVRWPGRTSPGAVCGQYVMIEDFYPSILDMAGIDSDKSGHYGHTIDPLSLINIIIVLSAHPFSSTQSSKSPRLLSTPSINDTYAASFAERPRSRCF